jgi:hypothetical protein
MDGVGIIRRTGIRASLRLEPHPRTASLAELPRSFTHPIEARWLDQCRFSSIEPGHMIAGEDEGTGDDSTPDDEPEGSRRSIFAPAQ